MRGCVPKKLLVMGAHFGEALDDARGFGWSIENASHDWVALIAAKDKELDRLEGAYKNLLSGAGNTLVEGHGVLVDPHTVEVNGKRLTAEKILLAVGGWPVVPDIPGREHMITSNEALDLKARPKRIVIFGGGSRLSLRASFARSGPRSIWYSALIMCCEDLIPTFARICKMS